MLTQILCAGLEGVDAYPIDVEVDIQNSQLPQWRIVGLAESAVRESKERVVAAIKNCDLNILFRKVTINLAPADKKKEGTAFDLPIAIGLLVASDSLGQDTTQDTMILGELGLTGDLRGVKGVLSMAMLAKAKGCRRLIVPQDNAKEASLVQGLDIFAFAHLRDVVDFLKGISQPQPLKQNLPAPTAQTLNVDLNEVSGQWHAKRALEIAAAGGHNLLLCGPPGSGKTMLASRLPTIMPKMNLAQALDTSKIYSVVGESVLPQTFWVPPFRSPHHSVSYCGLMGGGSYPKPGEVSLAHNGVLFLDEIFEFQRHVLEQLRQPLESRRITISRAQQTVTYPADFLLVASCNPCPCGYKGHPKMSCVCSPTQIQRYQAKMSGPLLDRIDLQVDVPAVSFEDLRGLSNKQSEDSKTVLERVLKARSWQETRLRDSKIKLNAQMSVAQWRVFCELDIHGERILKTAMEKFHLSARGVARVLKVARTIADLASEEKLKSEHVLEALQYRRVEMRGV